MAKAPREGEVKTRLVPPLTAAEAMALSIAFIRDTAENILAAAEITAIDGFVAYSPPGSAASFAGVVPEAIRLLPPRRIGLGASLLRRRVGSARRRIQRGLPCRRRQSDAADFRCSSRPPTRSQCRATGSFSVRPPMAAIT